MIPPPALKSNSHPCHKAKYIKLNVLIVENDTQYSGASWAVLTARKSRIIQQIERFVYGYNHIMFGLMIKQEIN